MHHTHTLTHFSFTTHSHMDRLSTKLQTTFKLVWKVIRIFCDLCIKSVMQNKFNKFSL